MSMKNPAHPGLIVRHDCLDELGLSVAEGAKVLGVTRQALNNVVSGKSAVTSEMAVRLEMAFGVRAEVWLAMQTAYDLAQVRQHEGDLVVQRVTSHRLDQPQLG